MATDLTAWAEALSKFSGLLQLVYEDLAQPGVRQAGKALETVVGLGNTVLWPLTLANERARLSLQANMERYRKKMESIAEENVIPVLPEIGVPIVEKLGYVSDEKLAELYTELLAQASNRETVERAHPSFVNIINNISPDEAVLIRKLKSNHAIPFARAIHSQPALNSERELAFFPNHDWVRELSLGHNLHAYISNFSGLGLLSIENDRWLMEAELYAPMLRIINDMFQGQTELANKTATPGEHLVLKTAKGMATLTPFGRKFIEACVR